MVGGVAFFYRNEKSAASGANLPFGLQRQLDTYPVLQYFGRLTGDRKHGTKRRGATKLNIVLGRHRARWFIQVLSVHEGHSSRPVSMAVEQRPNDATVHHTGEGLVMVFWHVFHSKTTFNAIRIDLKTVFVGRSAPEANRRRGVDLLDTFLFHVRMRRNSLLGSSLHPPAEC